MVAMQYCSSITSTAQLSSEMSSPFIPTYFLIFGDRNFNQKQSVRFRNLGNEETQNLRDGIYEDEDGLISRLRRRNYDQFEDFVQNYDVFNDDRDTLKAVWNYHGECYVRVMKNNDHLTNEGICISLIS